MNWVILHIIHYSNRMQNNLTENYCICGFSLSHTNLAHHNSSQAPLPLKFPEIGSQALD